MKIQFFITLYAVYLKRWASSEKWQRFFFALLSAILILLFIKIPIKRYELDLHEGQILHTTEFATYLAQDLDNDGNTERIYIYSGFESERFSITLYNNTGLIKETISFIEHDWTPNSVPAVYDINGDQIKEVLTITVKQDSVFLNVVNLYTLEYVINNLLIGIIERPQKELAFGAKFLAFEDFNGDGEKELYFNVDAGYGLKPRGLFRLDVESMKIYHTPESYIVWRTPVIKDLNNDGKPEFIPFNSAPCNVHFETEYTDGRAWIGAFDLEMKSLFPPIPMPEGYGYVEISPATFSDTLFFAFYSNRSTDSVQNQIFLIDYHGNVINQQTVFHADPTVHGQTLALINNKNYLLINNIGKFELTASLKNLPQQKIKKQKDYQSYFNLQSWLVDVNDDGTKELFYYHSTTSVIEIRDQNYKLLASLQLPFDRIRITNIFPFQINGVTERVMIATNSGYFFLKYIENSFFWIKYLVWLAIFIATYTITFLIQYFQRRRMEAKWETEKQLTELQFNTIRNQLNPHFIFNALNSVGYLIENGKKEEAYDYLSINTRLIRKVLDDAEMTTRTLEEEIQFVKDYLAIQEFRFKERYQTIFSIDEKVDLKLLVPKMVLHTYVENSVKHAFKNIYSGGILEIKLNSLPNGVLFTVRDNGFADDLPFEPMESTGKGISIMESYYRLFEKQHKCKIHSSFTNLNNYNSGITGTEVIVRIMYQ